MGWIKDPQYLEIVTGLWNPINLTRAKQVAVQFVENLKKVKKATVSWAHEKKNKDREELVRIEAWL